MAHFTALGFMFMSLIRLIIILVGRLCDIERHHLGGYRRIRQVHQTFFPLLLFN
jgi:hypothetical protein